ncbi:hypothetical protein [Sulfobacillus thermosulfidooxidans]|uniref:hypothetical protein n=1 Tax=Sulfobacillus thermosulfidooxidans TaxID=28034 RepID=UPI0006B46962|nr:hypothetical protein [Sulfobacillus thermosulfidooxidans]
MTYHLITDAVPTRCARCQTPFRPARHHGRWQRYCSLACARRASSEAKQSLVKTTYGLADDAALRAWLIDQLNHRSATTVAALCGVHRQALMHWMRQLGIRKVVRFE